jgi:hypothetical protein
MSNDTPNDQSHPSRESLEKLASALTQQHETARLLARFLVAYTSDRDLAHATQDVIRSFTQAPSVEPVINELVARLEAERPQFFDPNRPGE